MTEASAPSARSTGLLRGLALWLPALAAGTVVLWTARDVLHEAHVALAYLLIVLGGSAQHGRGVGVVLAVLAFGAFNFFLLPPFYTLTIEDPLDWWILISFLITGAVAAQLMHRSQRALTIAEERASEVERLSSLGAESLSAPSAGEAVGAIARVVAGELGVSFLEILVVDASGETRSLARHGDDVSGVDPQLVRHVVREGSIVGVSPEGTVHVAQGGRDLGAFLAEAGDRSTVLVPLRVRDRTIGVLRLGEPRGLSLEAGGAAYANTLSYYAALAVERARLAAEAEHVGALREADRLKDALLTSVSHDLRTPLTTIRALGSELRATGDERAAVIEAEAERLNRMVTDLLDLSSIRAGGLPISREIVAAEDLVGAALQRVRGVPGADRIEVRLPPGEALLVGSFDFVQALRALSNLLDNALRHGGAAQPVELEVGEADGEVLFRVMDRGAGVAPEDRERIFEPFHRARGPSAPSTPGSGLGLAIARSLAEAQGGGVRYRARAGGGSTLELTLPAAPDSQALARS